MRTPKFQVYPDSKGEFRWRLKAKNGRIIADGAEGYKTRANANRALDTVLDTLKTNVPIVDVR